MASYNSNFHSQLTPIWSHYLQAPLPANPHPGRRLAVALMHQCHRLLKLPLQTLFSAVWVYDYIIHKRSLRGIIEQSDDGALAVSALYCCQKLEKIRNYGINHWIKVLAGAEGMRGVPATTESMRKYEAYIMEEMEYKLVTCTVMDVLLGLWTLRCPSQRQFYFANYLMELSLFCSFECPTGQACCIDVALAIVNLSCHFFGKEHQSIEQLVDDLLRQMHQEYKVQDLAQRVKKVRHFSDILFEKLVRAWQVSQYSSIVDKYRKSANLSVSNYTFISRINNSTNVSLMTDTSQLVVKSV